MRTGLAFATVALLCMWGSSVVAQPSVAPPAVAPPAVAPPVASAGGPVSARDRAIALFKSGLELYAAGDYVGSRIEFQRAYDVAPNYKVLYNIGQVYFQLKDYLSALRSFREYVSQGGPEIPPDRMKDVQAYIAQLQPLLAALDITTTPPGAEITVDDRPVGTTPLAEPVPVNLGRRKVVASLAGHASVTRDVDVGGGETAKVQLDLPTGTIIVRAPPSHWTFLSWVGVGSGVALGITSGVFGGLAINAQHTLQNTTYTEGTAPPSASNTKTLSALADTFGVLAIATVVTTVSITLLHKPTESPSAVSLDVGPLGALVRGRF
jgi:hypothetical protein